MFRWLTSGLLLMLIFLAGVVFGMKQDPVIPQDMAIGADESYDEEIREETVLFDEMNDERVNEDAMQEDSDVMEDSLALNLTQKTASFLERSVKGFYEMIVTILYQIAQLFF